MQLLYGRSSCSDFMTRIHCDWSFVVQYLMTRLYGDMLSIWSSSTYFLAFWQLLGLILVVVILFSDKDYVHGSIVSCWWRSPFVKNLWRLRQSSRSRASHPCEPGVVLLVSPTHPRALVLSCLAVMRWSRLCLQCSSKIPWGNSSLHSTNHTDNRWRL